MDRGLKDEGGTCGNPGISFPGCGTGRCPGPEAGMFLIRSEGQGSRSSRSRCGGERVDASKNQDVIAKEREHGCCVIRHIM